MNDDREKTSSKTPLFLTPVPCGFPSPAQDYLEDNLDLNKKLIDRPAATFFVHAQGNSMWPSISDGDLLVVDRSKEAISNSVIMAVLDGEFTIKRMIKQGEKIVLSPDNKKYQPILIHPDSDFEVWGVVTYNIHSLR